METMKEWKNVLSDTGVSMDKQWMIAKIYEVIEPNVFEVSRPVQLVMIGDVLDWLWQNGYFYFCHHNKHVKFNWFKPVFSCEWVRSEEEKNSWWHGTNIYCKTNDYQVTLWDMREEKRKPIEDQSDECIDFIYNLIQQWS